MSRKKRGRKLSVEHYRKLAKKLSGVTVTDYSKKKKLSAQDKSRITRAANLIATGKFVRIKRSKGESVAAYQNRITDFQRSHHLPTNRNVAGIVAHLPDDAKNIRLTREDFSYELPAKRTKFGGRRKLRQSVKKGTRVRLRKDEDGNVKELSQKVRDGIRQQIRGALKGHKGPVQLFGKLGDAFVGKFTVSEDSDLDSIIDDIEAWFTEYETGGTLVFIGRSFG